MAAEEFHSVLRRVFLIVISGQPTQTPLLVVVDLNRVVVGAGHHQSSKPQFLNGYKMTGVSTDLGLGLPAWKKERAAESEWEKKRVAESEWERSDRSRQRQSRRE
ncbi:hypothetical protein GUJ93_ZPchr0005g14458 [Zizania palustris]|uniref:Uncharacterized protein n=1 Tax=Zizania palustris TaxID=103762 RepID=A0A8J5VCW8_ZIZPA|nr:hypothetical protein GUJ93_ZPchr0005g14458 [Zizania palustris]